MKEDGTMRQQLGNDIVIELMQMAEEDAELKHLMELAAGQAGRTVPDRSVEPVYDLASWYAFLDRAYRSLPWAIYPGTDHTRLYDQIDQSMGCLYFVCEQHLKELEGRGYLYPCLSHHEPFRSWFARYLKGYGSFLDTEESWREEFYQRALGNPDFQLDGGLYEDPANWKTFNQFFARKLSDPSKRAPEAPDDERVIVSPADAVPQPVREIDENGRIGMPDELREAGLVIKTAAFRDVSRLLAGSRYADSFAGGRLTHTLLDIYDYHRYHFPVSGTVKEVLHVPAADAPGGVITWNAETGRYQEYFSDSAAWQCTETRGIVIVETEGGTLAAVIPVGMCQVSSVNFEDTVVPGAKVKKGDPLGYFLFGGSDIVMLFSKGADFVMTAQPSEHLDAGREYGRIAR